jgi:Trypsin-like serine proteases, typically periplasmic, contain C-terminal PDZ domain
VQDNSFADEIGLQERDVVVSINRQPVASVDDVRKVQGTLKVGDAVAFRVMRPAPAGGRAVAPGNRAGRAGAGQYNSFYVSGTLTANP